METADLRVTCVDLNGKDWEKQASEGTLAFWAAIEGDLAQRSSAMVARLARSALKAQRPLRLHMPRRGSLTNLRPIPQKPSCTASFQGRCSVFAGTIPIKTPIYTLYSPL